MDQTFMKTKPVIRLILTMSLPMVISMTVTSLYNIVDSCFVAQISESSMTALSLVFPVQNVINAITIGFSVGISAAISFYLGAQKQESANIAATQGVLLSAVHGILLSIICISIMPSFLHMFTQDAEVIDLGLRYSKIAFSFAPIIALSMGYEKVFQSVGKMMMTMVSMLSGCILNIILDPIMIFGLGPMPAMGIEGAAFATGIGQTVSLLFYLLFYFFRPIPAKVSFRYAKPSISMWKRLYATGVPASLNLALPSLLISSLNSILAGYSEIYIVILGIYYKLQTFLYLPAGGIVQGIRPLIGYNYGAGEYKRVKKIYSLSLFLAMVIMVIGTILCWTVPTNLMTLFTSNAETIQAGSVALQIISIGFIVSAVSVISSGALEGLSMGGTSLLISLIRFIITILPIAYILSKKFGPIGVWHAFWISELITAMISYILYHKKTSQVA